MKIKMDRSLKRRKTVRYNGVEQEQIGGCFLHPIFWIDDVIMVSKLDDTD